MQCSLFGPIAVSRCLTLPRQITGTRLRNDHRYASLSLALQQGVHLQRGGLERIPFSERRVSLLEAMVC